VGVGPFRVRSPAQILALDAEGADALLTELEASVPLAAPVEDLPGRGSALVFADTHGDWRTSTAIAETFLGGDPSTVLVGLGDYVDRAPDDCPNGSVANALYLLGLRAAFPDRVFLLKGNHETVRMVPALPNDLPEEVDDLWGPEVARYARILGLLERGPWAAVSSNGLYLAHGGFPLKRPAGAAWRSVLDHPTEAIVLDTVWRDASVSRIDRGVGAPFTERDLELFQTDSATRLFLRGHDARLAGQWIFHERCLTLHSTRIYERYGGVLQARVPLDRPIAAPDVVVEHVRTEGRTFDDAHDD
jgi:Calcineurin-like phosphoesterase